MTTSEKFRDADHLSLPVPPGKKSGDPVRFGGTNGLNGVCETDRADSSQNPYVNGSYDMGPWGGGNPDGYASVSLVGAYEFTVTGATQFGTRVYIASDDTLTTKATEDGTPSGTPHGLFGHALGAKGAAEGPCDIRIRNGVAA